MTEPAGAQDPALIVTPQQVTTVPTDAATVQQPEAVLPPDNGTQIPDDDDEGPSYEKLAAMRNAFFSQQQEQSAPPVVEPPVEAPAIPVHVPAETEQQFRVRAHDESEARVMRLLKADPKLSLQAAYGVVYGSTPGAPEAVPAAAVPPTVSDTSVSDAVNAIEAELRALAAEPWQEDFELKRTEKMLEHSRAVARAETASREAAMREAEAEEAAKQAEWNAVLAKYPRYSNPNDAQNVAAVALLAQWQATNDPRLNLPNLMTVVADTAAAELFARGDSRNHPSQHAPAPAPQAVPAARFNPAPAGGSPPPPVQMWDADALEELQDRDPGKHAQLMATFRQQAAARR